VLGPKKYSQASKPTHFNRGSGAWVDMGAAACSGTCKLSCSYPDPPPSAGAGVVCMVAGTWGIYTKTGNAEMATKKSMSTRKYYSKVLFASNPKFILFTSNSKILSTSTYSKILSMTTLKSMATANEQPLTVTY
jgi:hypothetical protein